LTAVARTVQPSFTSGQRLLGARQSRELEAGATSLCRVHEPALLGGSSLLPPTWCKLWLVFLTVLPALARPRCLPSPSVSSRAAGELGESTLSRDPQGDPEPCTFESSKLPPSWVETGQLQSRLLKSHRLQNWVARLKLPLRGGPCTGPRTMPKRYLGDCKLVLAKTMPAQQGRPSWSNARQLLWYSLPVWIPPSDRGAIQTPSGPIMRRGA